MQLARVVRVVRTVPKDHKDHKAQLGQLGRPVPRDRVAPAVHPALPQRRHPDSLPACQTLVDDFNRLSNTVSTLANDAHIPLGFPPLLDDLHVPLLRARASHVAQANLHACAWRSPGCQIGQVGASWRAVSIG